MSRLPRTPKPKPKWPLTTMPIGATFTRTFTTRYQRDNFRGNVAMQGKRYGKQFDCVTDGLSVTVTRVPVIDGSWIERTREACAHVPILTLDELRRLPEAKWHHAGIYFLWLGDSLQYVGQSINVGHRMLNHRASNAISYDRHTCLTLALDISTARQIQPKLIEYESAYIAAHLPACNVQIRGRRLAERDDMVPAVVRPVTSRQRLGAILRRYRC